MKLIIDESHMLIVFGLLALLLVLTIWRVLKKWSVSDTNTFEMVDLFMEHGRASKSAVVLLGAFAATTWFFVYYAMLGKMTEGYFGLYAGAWVAPIIARVLTGDRPAAQSMSVETKVTT